MNLLYAPSRVGGGSIRAPEPHYPNGVSSEAKVCRGHFFSIRAMHSGLVAWLGSCTQLRSWPDRSGSIAAPRPVSRCRSAPRFAAPCSASPSADALGRQLGRGRKSLTRRCEREHDHRTSDSPPLRHRPRAIARAHGARPFSEARSHCCFSATSRPGLHSPR